MNPVLALIIANVIWGAASPIFKFSLEGIPPFTLIFIRFFISSLLLLPFILGFSFRDITRGQWLRITASAVLGFTVSIGFFFLGLRDGQSINAPIIGSLSPLFLFLASVVFLHEKVKKRVLTGMFIAFIGAMLVVFAPLIFDGYAGADFNVFKGNIYFIIATIGAMASPIIMKDVLRKIDPKVITFLSFAICAVTFIPLAAYEFISGLKMEFGLPALVGILFGSIASSLIAYYLYFYGLSKIKVQEIGIFSYVDPLAAIVIAAPLLGEYPDVYFIIGSVLIFAGIYCAEKRLHYHPFHKIKEHPPMKWRKFPG